MKSATLTLAILILFGQHILAQKLADHILNPTVPITQKATYEEPQVSISLKCTYQKMEFMTREDSELWISD